MGQTGTSIKATARKIFKICTSRCSKNLKIVIRSLVLPVFHFLCKNFSKFLKSTLQNTIF